MKYLLLSLMMIIGCKVQRLPKESLRQYQLNNYYEFHNNALTIFLNNPLFCPVRVWIQSADLKLKSYLDQVNPITLNPKQDTILSIQMSGLQNTEIEFASRLGDLSKDVNIEKVHLPFQRNHEYPLIQGYDSAPTHNTDWSRYALDFGLSLGDTICAATDGYVVGVVEDYKHGGSGKEWKNYGNFITIYEPESGLFTQYTHLQFKGSLVEVGDKIKSGQAIGLAGMTGQTNIEHLHFNCLKPIHSEDGLISIPVDSIATYKVLEMNRNDLIRN